MPSKPVYIGGADVTLSSNEELRAYEAANPNEHVMSKHDNRLKDHKWRARERAESQARKQGWRDLDQRKQTQRAAKKKGKPAPSHPE
jgi:adenosyl cobinamide kinase/adenosyl cobinamide phosphate guanylyltransferase